MELAYFLAVSVIAVLAAVAVIVSRNSVHSALFMVVNLFCVAMLYLAAEFLAVVQITVYAGAIMVLFLFVVTMLNPAKEETPNRLANRLPLAVALGLVLLVGLSLALQPRFVKVAESAQSQASQAAGGNTQMVGGLLYTQYLLPFELASLLLLVGMVAAVVLGRKRA